MELDLEPLGFTQGELADLKEADEVSGEDSSTETRGGGKGLFPARSNVKIVIAVDKLDVIEKALNATGKKNRGDALLELAELYVQEKGQFDLTA